MQHLSPLTLENRWVRLEPLALSHLDALWQAGQDPRASQHLPARFESREDMERFVIESLERQSAGTALPCAIIERGGGRVVGSYSLFDFAPERRSAEIGWTWHCPEVWSTRVNLAAKVLLLEHAFESLQLVRVTLKTDTRNLRSQRAIEKLGAAREGIWRKHMKCADGSWRDSVFYSIIDDEWPEIKSRLLPNL